MTRDHSGDAPVVAPAPPQPLLCMGCVRDQHPTCYLITEPGDGCCCGQLPETPC